MNNMPTSTFVERHLREDISKELSYWDLTDEQKAENYRKLWFGGQGEFSMQRAAILHHKLDHALSMLSGSQQPPHWDREPTQEMLDREEQLNRETEEAGENAVLEIAAALGVKIKLEEPSKELLDAHYNAG
jgi:hypothetical protein